MTLPLDSDDFCEAMRLICAFRASCNRLGLDAGAVRAALLYAIRIDAEVLKTFKTPQEAHAIDQMAQRIANYWVKEGLKKWYQSTKI